jgi:hypothetical protein
MNPFSQPLSLATYMELVASLPVPTPVQMEQFAEFVSRAHSWYKHLPLLPPGQPFQFYLDPSAGMELVQRSDGKLEATPRLQRGFHYSWIPTDQYQARFGYLAFSQSSGPAVFSIDGTGARTLPSDIDCMVFDPNLGFQRPVPFEIFQAGRALISGIVHPASTSEGLLHWAIEANPNFAWPSESGGAAAWADIVARTRVLCKDPSQKIMVDYDDKESVTKYRMVGAVNFDIPLYDALEPERRRQRNGMIAAMVRVVKLVHPGYV